MDAVAAIAPASGMIAAACAALGLSRASVIAAGPAETAARQLSAGGRRPRGR